MSGAADLATARLRMPDGRVIEVPDDWAERTAYIVTMFNRTAPRNRQLHDLDRRHAPALLGIGHEVVKVPRAWARRLAAVLELVEATADEAAP